MNKDGRLVSKDRVILGVAINDKVFLLRISTLVISIFILCGCIFYIDYIVKIQWNIPFSQSMFDLLFLPENLYNGKLSFNDFRVTYVEHGLLGYCIIYLLNTVLFYLSTRVETIINIVMVIFCGVIMSRLYCNTVYKRNIPFYIGFGLIMIAMFTPTQGGGSGMDIQVRIGISLAFFTLNFAERLQKKNSSSLLSKLLLYGLIFFSYVVFGTFYTFSWIVAATFVYLLRMLYGVVCKVETNYKDYCLEILCMAIAVIVYFYFYEPPVIITTASNVIQGNIFTQLFTFIHSLIISLGSVTISYDALVDGNISTHLLYINSYLMTIIVALSVILYFLFKMWKDTLLPLIMILYTLAIFAQIYLGRGSGFYAYNTWYLVNTKFLFAAVIWIFTYAVVNNKSTKIKNFHIKFNYIRVTSALCILLLIIPLVYSHFIFYKRAIHVKNWLASKESYLTGELPLIVDDNGMTPLTYSLEGTENGIDFLRKHRLNIFHNLGTQYEYSYGKKIKLTSDAQTENNYFICGLSYPESLGTWTSGNEASLYIVADSSEHDLILSIDALPFVDENNDIFYQQMDIYVNNIHVSTINIDNKGVYEFSIPNDFLYFNKGINKITLQFPDAISPSELGLSEDNRQLALFISSVTIYEASVPVVYHWSITNEKLN